MRIKTILENAHSLDLLKKVVAQIDKDARQGDYTAIDELLENIPEEQLEGFLSDNLYPYVESKVTEGDGNMEGYLNTIDEYVEMLFNSAKGTEKDLSLSKESATTIAYRIQNAVDDIRTRELGLKPSNIRAKYNEESATDTRVINEIDPSRSPWTTSGKHPGAMNKKELKREIAVFDELMDRGDHLSPKEMMQLDSLWNYLDGDTMSEEITKEATYEAEKAKWVESRRR
tara:strand:+ start:781 stop:1467 length:687 start_codon:yes stop_codon:yes gene_type:complete